MDYLSLIKLPIEAELADFIDLFNKSLMHSDGLLSQVLDHIRQRAGKRMRPILILLMARNFGKVSSVTQHSAVGLELLHTASLVHDDVVDESEERRGQASVNATYDNKVAVLVGDFILSTALLHVSYSHSEEIVRYLAELGRILSNGEILQLNSISNEEISEDIYYQVIKQKRQLSLRLAPVSERYLPMLQNCRLKRRSVSGRTWASSSRSVMISLIIMIPRR